MIGAGFGGLGAAVRLGERGARVLVLEALTYPGGCASTFTRFGLAHEAGATLVSGFGPGQRFRRWIDRYELDVTFDAMDPVMELRAPEFRMAVPPRREDLVATLCALPDAPRDGIRRFFAEQARVADVLWELLDRPELLPPFDARAFAAHLRRAPRYLPVLRWMGRPVDAALERYGVARFTPLRTLVDALGQITVQAGVAEAEAPFALATLDYAFRGAGHVRGGIGRLAHALVDAVRRTGGTVRFADRVREVRPSANGWRVTARRETVEARAVIAGVLPEALAALTGAPLRGVLAELDAAVRTGWGACMLYRTLRADGGGPRHLELVDDPARPLIEGNHIFASLGESRTSPDGVVVQTLTVSTHVALAEFLKLDAAGRAARVDAIHARMRALLDRGAPEWSPRTLDTMTASPRTFERFTRRSHGFVGGIPRRAGLRNYRRLGPIEVERGLFLVGDTVFPGQSTLAAATGGVKTAERVAGRAGVG